MALMAVLRMLLQQMADKDRLRDNVLLAEAKLLADQHSLATRLLSLHQAYMGSDGGMEALFELGLLKIRRWREHTEGDAESRQKMLAEARTAEAAADAHLFETSIAMVTEETSVMIAARRRLEATRDRLDDGR